MINDLHRSLKIGYISSRFNFIIIIIKCKGILAVENTQLVPFPFLTRLSLFLVLVYFPSEMKFPELYAICNDWWLTSIKLWLQCRSFIKIHPPYYIKLYGFIHSDGIRAINIREYKRCKQDVWYRMMPKKKKKKTKIKRKKRKPRWDSFICSSRFVSIYIFCVIPLHGRTFWPRVQYRHLDVYRKKYNQRAPFVSFFIKITAPIPYHSYSCHSSVYLQLASTNECYYVEKLYSAYSHSWHCFLRCFTYTFSCLHTWIVCTFCSCVYRDAAADGAVVVADTFFLVVKQFPVKRVKVGDAFHHGIHSTVFDRHLHSLIQTHAHPSLHPTSAHSHSHSTFRNSKLCSIFKRVNTF